MSSKEDINAVFAIHFKARGVYQLYVTNKTPRVYFSYNSWQLVLKRKTGLQFHGKSFGFYTMFKRFCH